MDTDGGFGQDAGQGSSAGLGGAVGGGLGFGGFDGIGVDPAGYGFHGYDDEANPANMSPAQYADYMSGIFAADQRAIDAIGPRSGAPAIGAMTAAYDNRSATVGEMLGDLFGNPGHYGISGFASSPFAGGLASIAGGLLGGPLGAIGLGAMHSLASGVPAGQAIGGALGGAFGGIAGNALGGLAGGQLGGLAGSQLGKEAGRGFDANATAMAAQNPTSAIDVAAMTPADPLGDLIDSLNPANNQANPNASTRLPMQYAANGGQVGAFHGYADGGGVNRQTGFRQSDPPRNALDGLLDSLTTSMRGSSDEMRASADRGLDAIQRGDAKALADSIVNDRMVGAFAGMMAGPRAKTADLTKLARAKEMWKDFAGRDEILKATGWFQGADGKWRFEIPDHASQIGTRASRDFDQGSATGRASGVLWHNDLYEAYPDLRGLAVTARRTADTRGGEHYSDDRIAARAPDAKNLRSVMLHELQHAIQQREGFAPGGGPTWLAAQRGQTLENLRAKLAGVERDMRVAEKKGAPDYPGLMRERIDIEHQLGALERQPFDARDTYRRLAGEVEARNVQSRMDMTPEQRLARPPWDTEDVSRDIQILLQSRADGGEVGAFGPVSPGSYVPAGAFIVPADIPAAAGDGNSVVGQQKLAGAFGAVPIYGAGDGRSDEVPAFTDGGRLALSNGEMMIPPHKVRQAGGTDALGAFVQQERDRYRKKLGRLPGPRK